MTWLWLTLGAQFLFSVGAHVDKYLLWKYFQGVAPGSLILFSSLFSFVVLPVLAWLNPAVLAIVMLLARFVDSRGHEARDAQTVRLRGEGGRRPQREHNR